MAVVYELWVDECDPPSDGILVVLAAVGDDGQKLLIDSEHFDAGPRAYDAIASWAWYRLRHGTAPVV